MEPKYTYLSTLYKALYSKSYPYIYPIIAPAVNGFRGLFIHNHDSPKHFKVETYDGMFVTGYRCHKCSYEWYEKKNRHDRNLSKR